MKVLFLLSVTTFLFVHIKDAINSLPYTASNIRITKKEGEVSTKWMRATATLYTGTCHNLCTSDSDNLTENHSQ